MNILGGLFLALVAGGLAFFDDVHLADVAEGRGGGRKEERRGEEGEK